jgi:hypothetical protein
MEAHVLGQTLIAETIDVVCNAIRDVVERFGYYSWGGDVGYGWGVGAPGVAGYVEDCDNTLAVAAPYERRNITVPVAQTRKRKVKV